MKIVTAATRAKLYWQFFFREWQENFWNDLFSAPKTFLHYGKILLIKKHTYQNIYEWKMPRRYFSICSLIMIQSGEEIQLRHSAPEFCIMLIMN